MHIFRMMVGSREIKNAKIGDGSMGRPMIAKLWEKDFEVKLTINIPKQSVMAQGRVWTDTPKASGMEIENMMVQTGALARMHPGQTWMDRSTLDYHNTEYMAELAAQKRIDRVEAPVSNLWQMGSVEDEKTNAVKMGRMSLVAQKPGFY